MFWSHNRVVWVGPNEIPAALGSLAQALRAELEKEGFVVERRPFAAHVTLIRKAHPAAQFPPLPGFGWPVRDFALVRSHISAQGSSYEFMERLLLTA
jgi:2'-5' RNA ligase